MINLEMIAKMQNALNIVAAPWMTIALLDLSDCNILCKIVRSKYLMKKASVY